MPRKAMSPRAKIARAQFRLQKKLVEFGAEYQRLLREHNSVKGQSHTAQIRMAGSTVQIVELFDAVEEADFDLVAFAKHGLGPRPPEGTAEAADHDEFKAIAEEIARRNSRLPLRRPRCPRLCRTV